MNELPRHHRPSYQRCLTAIALSVSIMSTGACATKSSSGSASAAMKIEPESQTLHSGDVVMISFPGTRGLDTTQQIRRDGKINLDIIGEVKAADKTPAELEKELIQAFSSQLVSKEVKVTIVSSSFVVFVTGAVVHPGKILPDHTLSALEAIMEAGGFNSSKADSKGVVVIRHDGSRYVINLQAVLDGKSKEPFYLKSYDIVYVPEKIAWF